MRVPKTLRLIEVALLVDRRENELASHAKWPILGEKSLRNLGQKNETWAKKPGFPALFLSVSIERGGGIRKNFLGLANNSFAPHR